MGENDEDASVEEGSFPEFQHEYNQRTGGRVILAGVRILRLKISSNNILQIL